MMTNPSEEKGRRMSKFSLHKAALILLLAEVRTQKSEVRAQEERLSPECK